MMECMQAPAAYNDSWRCRKSAAFDLDTNSTARRAIQFDLFGKPVRVYANANLSIYSGQPCNARCRFCVEELRPASRGVALARQKTTEPSDAVYFQRLQTALDALQPLDPSVSITGGEPSLDPRLPRMLQMLVERSARKRTLTTNGAGLLRVCQGRRVIDWIAGSGVAHLNVSRAHPDDDRNARLMRMPDGLNISRLREAIQRATEGGVRVRLSCVLLRGAVDCLREMVRYLDFAAELGVTNVIFRQLMRTDPLSVERNSVVRYSDAKRVALEPLLDEIHRDASFVFQRQIVGYYYYVEVWRRCDVDVVFEEADLAQLEVRKRLDAELIHELVFHPNGMLASTWQPWDGVLNAEESIGLMAPAL